MINQKLSIKEFSNLTGIKKDNLRYYDNIGLIKPENRGENGYRYYSRQQLSTANIITTLRSLGVPIEEIKQLTINTTSEKTLQLFKQHNKIIEQEIKKLEESKLIMKTHENMIKQVLNHELNQVYLEKKSKEKIFLCPEIPKDLNEEEAGIFSYNYADSKKINLAFPQGSIISQKNLKIRQINQVENYYFKTKENANTEKPSGLYAVLYSLVDIWKPEKAYNIILNYIQEKGLTLISDAYEEYPLGDNLTQDNNKNYIKIEILVKKL